MKISLPHRQTLRLSSFDYRQPAGYFVTICTKDKRCIFGQIENDAIVLNATGNAIKSAWLDLQHRFSSIELDTYIIMPNHLHGILLLHPSKTQLALSHIIQTFKSITTRAYNEATQQQGSTLWQRSYYDRVLRNEDDLNQIREYIQTNPLRWQLK